ncbi:hypothetical protein OSTOST_05130 [Ostertagia ostertagi]
MVLDFSPYGAIISLLKDDAPYQVQMILHDDVTKADSRRRGFAAPIMKRETTQNRGRTKF